jgi:hypothetical protein
VCVCVCRTVCPVSQSSPHTKLRSRCGAGGAIESGDGSGSCLAVEAPTANTGGVIDQ